MKKTGNRTWNSRSSEHPVHSSEEAHWTPRLTVFSSETTAHSSEQAFGDKEELPKSTHAQAELVARSSEHTYCLVV